jgi:hypothetical protein
MMKRSLALCAGLLLLAGGALADPPAPQTETGTWEAVEAARMVATQNVLGDDPAAWEDIEGMALQNFPGNDGFGARANDDNDTAHYARGSTLIIHVFISHNGGTWDASERNAANAKAIVAKEHFLDIAPAAANLHFDNEGTTVYHYYSADLPYTIGDSGTNGTVVDDALAAIGFGDADSDGSRVDDMTMYLQGWNGGYDNVIASFQADVTGRAWASYGDAQIRLYTDSSGNVWAHEMGHSFGACDEYTEGGQCNGGIDCGLCQSWYLDYDVDNGNCQLATCPIDVSCIMINNTFGNVCDYTLKHWGWWDGNSDGQLDIVERRVSGDTFTNIWEIWHNGWFYWNSVDQGMVAHQKWNSWAVFGLRSPDTADYDPYLYAENNHNTELANSYTSQDIDFIVGDYNHSRIGNEHIAVQRFSGDTANYNLTFESGNGVLYADGTSLNVSWQDYNTVRAYDVPLFGGETVSFNASGLSAGMDIGIALFKSNGDTYFAGRTSAVVTSDTGGVGVGESFSYTVPEDDVYGLIVFANSVVDGDFDLRIGPAPYTLTEETPYYSAYDLRLFNYDPNAYYWSVIGTRPDASTNIDAALYADANYITELESSANYGNGATEFVAVDYLHASFGRDHWRVNKTTGSDNHRTEWEHDGEILEGWTNENWVDNHVAKIWDFHGTGGQNYFFREYHNEVDHDTGIYLFSSNDGDNYKRRSAYLNAANYQDPSVRGEWFNVTVPGTDWYGFVTIANDNNGGSYSIMAGPDNAWNEDVAQTWNDQVTYGSHTIPWSWWTVWGVRPGSGGDTGIWLYGDDAYTIDTLVASDQNGGGVNFVVGDYNHIGSGMTVYPRTIEFVDGGASDMEFEGGGESLFFDSGGASFYDLNWPTGDVVEIWDVWLNAGDQLHLIVEDLSGNLDLGASFFASNGAAWYGSEEDAAVSADFEGVGGTELLDFTATVTDWYGLVIHSNNDNGGDYRLVLQDLTTVAAGDLPTPANGLRTSSANPFAGSISLMYSLAGDGAAELEIFDVRGRKVRSLLQGASTAGRHETVWDGKNDAGQNLPGGVYLARLKAGGEQHSTKLIRMH